MPADAPAVPDGIVRVHGTRAVAIAVEGDRVTLSCDPSAFAVGLLVRWLGYVWRVVRLRHEQPRVVELEAWGRTYLDSPKLAHSAAGR
jgi:light-regulated signal transduction histidine kinase (bacteriophytochrome)